MEKDICYVDLLDIESIIPIIQTMGQIIYPEYGTVIGPFTKEDDDKNLTTYFVEFTSGKSLSRSNRIIIKSSNGKELNIEHVIIDEFHYYDISYPLFNGTNISFVFKTPTISRTVPIIDRVSIGRSDLVTIKYEGKNINNNVISNEENQSTLKLHKDIIKVLNHNQFNREELLMIKEKIDDKMFEEHEKRLRLINYDLINGGRNL